MCLVGVFEIRQNGENLRAQVLRMSGKIRHRGPDWSGIYCGTNTILSHERLSIVDPESGGQPLKSKDGKLILAVNGEIYNHRATAARSWPASTTSCTGSDCEVILPLYRKYGAVGCLDRAQRHLRLRALRQRAAIEYLVARDPVGDHPALHRLGRTDEPVLRRLGAQGARRGMQRRSDPFEPGHYRWSREGKTTRWYTRDWLTTKPSSRATPTPDRAARGARSGRPTAVDVRRSLRRAAVGRTRFVDHLGRSQTLRRPPHRDRTDATVRGGPASTRSPSA